MDKTSNRLFFPFDFLSNTSQIKVVYVLGAIAISIIPVVGISYLIFAFFPDVEPPEL